MDMGMNSMGSGLDFATFMNSALRNNGDGVWGGGDGILFLFLLILLAAAAVITPNFYRGLPEGA